MASEHSQELMWAVKNGDLDVVRQLVEEDEEDDVDEEKEDFPSEMSMAGGKATGKTFASAFSKPKKQERLEATSAAPIQVYTSLYIIYGTFLNLSIYFSLLYLVLLSSWLFSFSMYFLTSGGLYFILFLIANGGGAEWSRHRWRRNTLN